MGGRTRRKSFQAETGDGADGRCCVGVPGRFHFSIPFCWRKRCEYRPPRTEPHRQNGLDIWHDEGLLELPFNKLDRSWTAGRHCKPMESIYITPYPSRGSSIANLGCHEGETVEDENQCFGKSAGYAGLCRGPPSVCRSFGSRTVTLGRPKKKRSDPGKSGNKRSDNARCRSANKRSANG